MNNLYDFLVPSIPPLSEFVPDITYEGEDTHKICTRNNYENTMDIAMDKSGDDETGAFVYQCSQTEKKMIATESSSLNSERGSKKRTRKISEDIHHDVQSKFTKIPKGKGDSITAALLRKQIAYHARKKDARTRPKEVENA